eukprot:TRINITY_DN1998_c0_g1_i3.p2 TRINITY_DN1998_c0_g1~~TRINITY_DN1998_c0_g1_i3.p2  ORF type:complete len:208 (-),score=69.48 TRINITY_DN1998_c0_g1_i3:204-827(-)
MQSYVASWLNDYYTNEQNEEGSPMATPPAPQESTAPQCTAAVQAAAPEATAAVVPSVVPASAALGGKGGKGAPAMRGGKGGKGPAPRGGGGSTALEALRAKTAAQKQAAAAAALLPPKQKSAAQLRAPRPKVLDFEKELRDRIKLGTAGLKSAKPKPAAEVQEPELEKSNGSVEMNELTKMILKRRGHEDGSSDDDLDWEASGASIL